MGLRPACSRIKYKITHTIGHRKRGCGSGVRLVVTQWPDRTPLLPRDKQGGIRCGDVRYLLGAPGLGPAPGDWPSDTVFVDSTAAIDRVRTDALGPGQRFAIAAIEVCDRVLSRDNEVTIRWVPAHSKVAGNEQADKYAKATARRLAPHNDGDDVPDELLTEASHSHMSRSATRASAERVTSHVRPERRYRPPPGSGLRRQHLRNTKKDLAGRYYQFLSGHGAFGSYLKKMSKVDTDRCWFCNTGER
jgi:hypothetical protein